ncbi:MAG: rod shape-determining protein MreC [Phycisphaerales bacterium]
MSRSSHWFNPRSTLTVVSASLFIVALLPAKALTWVEWVTRPVPFIVQPIQKPLQDVVRWMQGSPAPSPGPGAEHLARIEQLQTSLLAERETSDRLRRELEESLNIRRLNPETTRRLIVPIVGGSADASSGTLSAKAGLREGVEVGSFAAHAGVDLVGRVTKAFDRTCLILPITRRGASAKNAPYLTGVVMLGDLEKGPLCELRATGDGTFEGTVLDRIASQSFADIEIKPGMLVRLADKTWPSGSQMLVIGEVTSVRTEPTQHRMVRVPPRVRLDRVNEVWISVGADKGEGGEP